MDKIFINIASYRDPTLIDTIKDALQKSKNPDRLVFGLGLQYHDDEIPDLSFIPQNQLKIIKYDVDNRPGLVKIRYEISQLVTDENYFLMIDSHSEFCDDWDYKLISEHEDLSKIIKNKNFVFSGFKVNHSYTIDFQYIFFNRHSLSFTYQYAPIKKWSKETPTMAVSCSSLFAPVSFLTEVGLDKYSDFLYEEPYLAWRLYINDWKVYVPEDFRVKQDIEKRSKYLKYSWKEEEKSNIRFKTQDSEQNSCEIFITMLTNLSGKYSVKNPKSDPSLFFNQNNTLNIESVNLIKDDIFKLNSIVNGNIKHEINDKLINSLIVLSKYMNNYRVY